MERRQHPRVLLDTPMFIQIEIVDQFSIPVMLTDMSRGGVQLAFPPQEKRMQECLGREVKLLQLPPLLLSQGSECCGHIAWLSPQRCGVKLDQPFAISNAELEQILKAI